MEATGAVPESDSRGAQPVNPFLLAFASPWCMSGHPWVFPGFHDFAGMEMKQGILRESNRKTNKIPGKHQFCVIQARSSHTSSLQQLGGIVVTREPRQRSTRGARVHLHPRRPRSCFSRGGPTHTHYFQSSATLPAGGAGRLVHPFEELIFEPAARKKGLQIGLGRS